MKQHITVDDLKTLTDEQKKTLNSLWLPAVYDRVAAYVCIDAENDVYEYFEFVVGEIILGHGTNITLRRLRLMDEMIIGDEDSDEFPQDDASDDALDDAFMDGTVNDTGEYFSKADCLPLLSIGQLITFLRNTKAGQNGFSIGIPPLNDKIFEQGFTLDDRFGEVSKADELTDLLFDMIKEVL